MKANTAMQSAAIASSSPTQVRQVEPAALARIPPGQKEVRHAARLAAVALGMSDQSFDGFALARLQAAPGPARPAHGVPPSLDKGL